MEKNININLSEGQKELVVRKGEALPLEQPKGVSIEGTIESVAEYIVKRSPEPENTHVLIGRDSFEIKLVHRERSKYSTDITGKMILTKEFESLKLGVEWNSTESLAKTLRKLRRHFASIDENTKLISAIRNYKANVQYDSEKTGDDRGNKKRLSDRKVNSSIPESFKITLPIFKGCPAKTFVIDIFLEVRGGSFSIVLDSIEAEELKKEIADLKINTEIERIPEAYPVFEL